MVHVLAPEVSKNLQIEAINPAARYRQQLPALNLNISAFAYHNSFFFGKLKFRGLKFFSDCIQTESVIYKFYKLRCMLDPDDLAHW
jgi:hypothetical protein